ncbi:TetR/AcrR family transcriptional regulator [Clostridium formicaceticum]|uniref:DNA-binding transcriptional repressor FabR n=1 Tax=Clostridium formicaceticum TaxID=1497 RepID=A0AAC9RL10_9CLOT|nr:TetR/AcrR family transcriptional regulator [Clostridium formicaceticum]AOY74669.1 TetR family transcriptional regulator [Clostridium formicaceticum]ARE89044.1 DNA-binding transcriptional repressor FabR [Clostridium formicaceticum]
MKTTKEAVIQAASDIADEKGLNNLSLKVLAEKLNIRTPSLYNHIDCLDDLLRAVAHNGMRQMNEQMKQAAIGKSGTVAIKAVSVEYLNYMIEHSGVYEIIQWATWHGTEETASIFDDYLSLLITLIKSCDFSSTYTNEILNMLTGIIHGYTTLQLRYAFSNPDKVRSDLCNALDSLLSGIQLKYTQQADEL